MSGGFQVIALEAAQFRHLGSLGGSALAELGVAWVVADDKPGFPCRVSLVDADVGERVLSLPFVHHDVAGPYRSSGPIFVREAAETARPAVNEVPEMLLRRLLSLRAYDADGMLAAAAVVQGTELASAIGDFFVAPSVGCIHVHNAAPGCYNCRVVRA